MKSIDELKEIVFDGVSIDNGIEKKVVRRFPNNIIMIDGKSISWKNFYNLLKSGYILDLHEDQQNLFSDVDKTNRRGGVRPGSGRKKMDAGKKKVVKSISLSPKALYLLNYYLEGFEGTDIKKPSISQVIEDLILKNF